MTTNQENILGLCTLKLYKSITTAAFEWANLIFWRKNLSGCNYLSAKFNSTAPWPKNWSSYFLLCCFHPKKGFVSFFRFNDQRWIRKDTLPSPRLDPRPQFLPGHLLGHPRPHPQPRSRVREKLRLSFQLSKEMRNQRSRFVLGKKFILGVFFQNCPNGSFLAIGH